ncbi:Ig-like domain-containing protein [Pareuzebyella sediminis]|uniref:Ig-like domain-containing protein n=1 Tax=Pareuzebyella sediminis TaxID=2607998 RepID=UPI0011EDC5AB|nr:Ig-like domain-containing protein [Pareuzebyella sediminis]
MKLVLVKYRTKMVLRVGILLFLMSFLVVSCKKDDDGIQTVKTLSLNKNQLQMELGNSESLAITSDIGDQTVSWTSTDPLVANIDESGTVAAVGFGTAIITATAGEMSTTCDVEITLPELALNQTEVSLALKDTVALAFTSEIGNTEVIWESSDPLVAEVADNGTVTAINFGTAEISAAAGDKTTTCDVEVILLELHFDQIELSLVEGSNKNLTIATDIGNAPVVWNSSDHAIATVNNGVVIAHTVGEVTISATVEGISAECVVTVREPFVFDPGIIIDPGIIVDPIPFDPGTIVDPIPIDPGIIVDPIPLSPGL